MYEQPPAGPAGCSPGTLSSLGLAAGPTAGLAFSSCRAGFAAGLAASLGVVLAAELAAGLAGGIAVIQRQLRRGVPQDLPLSAYERNTYGGTRHSHRVNLLLVAVKIIESHSLDINSPFPTCHRAALAPIMSCT